MGEPIWQDTLVRLFIRYEAKAELHREQMHASIGAELTQRTLDLCRHAIGGMDRLSEDKANRWLGFVQGVMIASRVLNIEEEREFTRPLFHALKGVSETIDTRSPKTGQP